MISKETPRFKKYFSETLQFLKKSYPPILRNLLIAGMGTVLIWGCMTVYIQKFTADEKIVEIKNKINQEDTGSKCVTFKGFGNRAGEVHCFSHDLNLDYASSPEIQELNKIKESSLFDLFLKEIFPFLLFIACVVIGIPIARILWLFVKRLYKESGQAKEELAKMTSYQRYTVILLIVILIVLILIMIR